MSLYALVLAALIAWVPPAEHTHLEPPSVTWARYESIARTITTVVVEARGERVEGSAEFEALLLASVASAESHLAARVDDCRVGLGGAWSLWQVTRPRREVCRSREAAARVALEMIRTSWRACARLPIGDRLSWFTDGSCRPRWWRSRSRVERALVAWSAADLRDERRATSERHARPMQAMIRRESQVAIARTIALSSWGTNTCMKDVMMKWSMPSCRQRDPERAPIVDCM